MHQFKLYLYGIEMYLDGKIRQLEKFKLYLYGIEM